MASERVPFANPVKFGDDLELDPGAYELRRAGRPLKLERIPMELLLLLVEQHGQLVTREHIIERIWGKDVFPFLPFPACFFLHWSGSGKKQEGTVKGTERRPKEDGRT